MAEPQPPSVHEGATTPPAPPAAASAAAEAAALSSLDNKTLSDSANAPRKKVDLKALNDAMKALDTTSGGKKAAAAAVGGPNNKRGDEPAKLLKVDGADVTLLAEQLDISRLKATELLRAHDADAVRAMKAWISAPA